MQDNNLVAFVMLLTDLSFHPCLWLCDSLPSGVILIEGTTTVLKSIYFLITGIISCILGHIYPVISSSIYNKIQL